MPGDKLVGAFLADPEAAPPLAAAPVCRGYPMLLKGAE
jgi:hypothetical protein